MFVINQSLLIQHLGIGNLSLFAVCMSAGIRKDGRQEA